MKILDRYILKAHIAPFFFAIITIIFVMMLHFISLVIERFVGKGLDFFVIAELIILQTAWLLVLAVPMAVLIATLMTFGSLTNRSEIAVMRSSGLSPIRLILPVLVAGAVTGVLLERFNNVILPEVNYQAKQLLRDITRTKPSFGLKENAFSQFIDGYSILVRDIDNETEELHGITIYEGSREQHKSVITAERGMVSFTPDYHYLIMMLYNGEIHELATDGREEYRLMTFEKHRFVFSSTGYGFERSDTKNVRRGDRELSASQLQVVGREFLQRIENRSKEAAASLAAHLAHIEKSAAADRPGSGTVRHVDRNQVLDDIDIKIRDIGKVVEKNTGDRRMYSMYMVEYHKKYALAFACVVFVLVGAPLGILARRGGFGVGAGLSLAFFVLYWAFLMLGENLADTGRLAPGPAIWLANVVMLTVGVLALLRVSGKAGGSHR
ncbi:YjgP/YjgQ family permease [Prosthecochloris sp. ZM_2]|uniref:LptF/LptG family permease n=1 Tax=Prosthecochloris sp. ZM_2 TaxID=2045206 RepID=UPI000DF722B9|nr:LptF/LptG family permease [Prosthecochloris sp. ZM_2]RNA65119.1 YjgP/YjgQ family permease [Prosthecochloris sp. ZM_2]